LSINYIFNKERQKTTVLYLFIFSKIAQRFVQRFALSKNV